MKPATIQPMSKQVTIDAISLFLHGMSEEDLEMVLDFVQNVTATKAIANMPRKPFQQHDPGVHDMTPERSYHSRQWP